MQTLHMSGDAQQPDAAIATPEVNARPFISFAHTTLSLKWQSYISRLARLT